MRLGPALAVLLLSRAVSAPAQEAPAVPNATPPAPAKHATPKAKRAGPPLDFSGVWELDAKASHGVSPAMEKGAVLSVRQNGNHIWIEPIERKKLTVLSEEVIVDGRKYEKALGTVKKGTLVADWGKDGTSLWLQVEVPGEDGGPPSGSQRAIWRLRDGGTVWTRQTRTVTKDDVKDTFLIFRKREAEKKN